MVVALGWLLTQSMVIVWWSTSMIRLSVVVKRVKGMREILGRLR